MIERSASNAQPDFAAPFAGAAAPDADDTGWLITFSDLVLQLFAFVLVVAVCGGAARQATGPVASAPPVAIVAADGAVSDSGATVDARALRQRPDALSAYQAAPRPDPLGGLEASAWAGDTGGAVPATRPEAAPAPAEAPPAEIANAATDEASSGRMRTLGTYLDAFVSARGDADDASIAVGDSDVRLDFGGRLGFRPGASDLLPAGRALVHELQRIASGIPNLTIEVSGYTDDVPIHTRQFPSNLELSLARAARVAREIERGDPSLAVRTVALGFAEHHALAPNDRPENRARNRRVEVRLVAHD